MTELQTVLHEKIDDWSVKVDKTLDLQHELQTVLREKLDDWSVKVDRLLQLGDEQSKVGRLLVEERAKTLDLQRQIYRLEQDLERRQEELEQGFERRQEELEQGFERRQEDLRELLGQAEQTVGRLARSRTLRRLSFLTTRPLRSLGQAQYLLEQMKIVLDRG